MILSISEETKQIHRSCSQLTLPMNNLPFEQRLLCHIIIMQQVFVLKISNWNHGCYL